MATKVYCDRCNKELNYENGEDKRIVTFFENDDDNYTDNWDFCEHCYFIVKRNMLNAIVGYEKPLDIGERKTKELEDNKKEFYRKMNERMNKNANSDLDHSDI